MASKNGSCLRKSERQKILIDLRKKGELESESLKSEALEADHQLEREYQKGCKKKHDDHEMGGCGTGCLSCGKDDDHANLLLCETCNGEYHTYCLEPPLRAVPTGEWYCSECKARVNHMDDDGLDLLVNALKPCFTERFGEICWAQGGNGFGWWPAFIYDPRHTIGSARQLARKNLGKKHLVYFFECHDAPFSVISTAKITKWEAGLIDDFHLGKVARGAGLKRTKTFRQALQAATIEAAKPIEMRLDWNHSELPQILPIPQPKTVPPPALKKRRRKEEFPGRRSSSTKSRSRGFPLMKETSSMVQIPTRQNLDFAVNSMALTKECANPIVEFAEDGELFVKLMKKKNIPLEGISPDVPISNSGPSINVGFVKLESRKSSSFADARQVIEKELVPDAIALNVEWRFFVPDLGPVSKKQEASLGPMLAFICRATHETNFGVGTLMHPLKVFIVEMKSATCTTDIATSNDVTTNS